VPRVGLRDALPGARRPARQPEPDQRAESKRPAGQPDAFDQEERAELRTALKDAGLELGDLVKLRLW
jgi:hypothetical protein